MFTIKHIKELETNVLTLASKNSSAAIYLNQGASLQELHLNGHELIREMSPLAYNKTYASSILFPFANRIKDGTYEFNGEKFQFEINEKELNNALHGLVFNQEFKVISTETQDDYAAVVLNYQALKRNSAFPYTYTIQLEYVLRQNTLDLTVEVKNTDSKTFPFTLGWHPYFLSTDLYHSSVRFDANKKLKLCNRNITEGVEDFKISDNLKVQDQFMDDCYILNSGNIEFLTPKYKLHLSASEKESFLQLYTPPFENAIAIEPTTGVSDSFNNGIGLKTLEPQETYKIGWSLKITDN